MLVDSCIIEIKASPKAAQNRISIDQEGTIRVAVTAAPANNEANRAVIELLAKTLGIAKSHLDIVRGGTSRTKMIRVEGLSEPEVRARIQGGNDA